MAMEIAALQGGATPEAARNAAREHAARGDEVLFDAISALYDDLGASYVELADAYAKLQQSSEIQLKEAQRLAHLGSWELDLTKNHLKWSDEIFRIFEIDPEQFSASYEAFREAIHPEDRERVNAAYANSLKTRLPYEIDHRLLMADGRIKHVHERCSTYYDTAGTPLHSLGTVQDVTENVLNQEILRESEERFRTIANYTFDWEYWRGTNNDFLFVSPSCLRVSGYSAEEFVADPGLLLKIIHPEDRPAVERHMKEEHHPEAATLDFRIVRRDGKLCWISHGCRPVYAEDGRFLGRRASNRDITDRKLLENELQEQAQSDYLTGLPNRRHFIERGEEELARTKRYGRPMSLLMLDIDHFKAINDTHGHQAGDLALQMMADHCREVLREIDVIGRVGGEEFAIILPETDRAGANRIAERLRASIAGKVMATEKGATLGITVSIGLATHAGSDAEANLDGLIKQADEALYEAKRSGRNRVCVFRP
jgi:diguanylate cyclase (GGDEF)-like protein/PAS domain S-box-containing protein